MKLTEAMEITGSVTERIQAVDIDLCIHGSSIAVSYKLHDFPASPSPVHSEVPPFSDSAVHIKAPAYDSIERCHPVSDGPLKAVAAPFENHPTADMWIRYYTTHGPASACFCCCGKDAHSVRNTSA